MCWSKRCASVQSHTGSVVRRQAAENLASMFQPATDGSDMWRGRKETHVIYRDLSVVFSYYKCSCVDVLYSIYRRITTYNS